MKTILTSLLVAGSLLPAPVVFAAAKGTPAQQAAAAKKQLDDANAKLKEANSKHDAAEKEFKKAEGAHKAAAAKIQEARLTATRELSGKLGLAAAQATDAAARREADTTQTALIAEIKKQPDYLAAVKDAEAASKQLKAVRDDTSLSDEERQKKSSALSATIRRPAELEKNRLAADPALKKMLGQAGEAAARLAAIRKEVQSAIEADPSVKTAAEALKKADTDLAKEKGELAKSQKDVATAQAKVNTENQQYQRELAQEKQSQAKKKKN